MNLLRFGRDTCDGEIFSTKFPVAGISSPTSSYLVNRAVALRILYLYETVSHVDVGGGVEQCMDQSCDRQVR